MATFPVNYIYIFISRYISNLKVLNFTPKKTNSHNNSTSILATLNMKTGHEKNNFDQKHK